MFNKSFDAAFMVPMAVSLGWGVVFATFITLVLVPTIYLILEDIRRVFGIIFGREQSFEELTTPDTVIAAEANATRETFAS